MIHIMIAEKDPARVQALSETLRSAEDMDIISVVSTRETAIKQLSSTPDILILNPSLLKEHTLTRFIRSVQLKSSGTKVIHFLNAATPDEFLISDIKTGTRGYIKTADPPAVILKAIRSVHEGEIWAERRVLEKAMANPMLLPETIQSHVSGLTPLTTREREMLNLVLQGASNREIANKSSISERTVKTHLYRVYRKLNVKSRTKAIALLSHS